MVNIAGKTPAALKGLRLETPPRRFSGSAMCPRCGGADIGRICFFCGEKAGEWIVTSVRRLKNGSGLRLYVNHNGSPGGSIDADRLGNLPARFYLADDPARPHRDSAWMGVPK